MRDSRNLRPLRFHLALPARNDFGAVRGGPRGRGQLRAAHRGVRRPDARRGPRLPLRPRDQGQTHGAEHSGSREQGLKTELDSQQIILFFFLNCILGL